ncbi:hypothetical protein FS749_007635 [Ceratobasidium sp. UAMH 11750]|nr:hypothetical protein FS749_007635 [Ceratobasidium sp. UAMH 11750]
MQTTFFINPADTLLPSPVDDLDGRPSGAPTQRVPPLAAQSTSRISCPLVFSTLGSPSAQLTTQQLRPAVSPVFTTPWPHNRARWPPDERTNGHIRVHHHPRLRPRDPRYAQPALPRLDETSRTPSL